MRTVTRHRAMRAVVMAVTVIAFGLGSSCRAPISSVGTASVVPASVQTWSGEGLSGRLLSTEHFSIISTLEDREFEAALPRFLEAAYRRYATIIPPSAAEGRRLTTFIFGMRWEWERFIRRRFASRYDVYSHIVSGGFAEGTTAVSFHRDRSSTLATLAHEGWHQYVAAQIHRPIPAWLDEGFACYHEAVDFAGPKPHFTPQHNTFRINSLRDAIRSGRLLPLREIINTDAARIIAHDHREAAQIYYAQVWALVTFLRYGAEGRYAAGLQRMLEHIADGSFHVRASAARLTGTGDDTESTAECVFRTYFSQTVEEAAGPYRKHLMRIAGFRGGDTSTSQ